MEAVYIYQYVLFIWYITCNLSITIYIISKKPPYYIIYIYFISVLIYLSYITKECSFSFSLYKVQYRQRLLGKKSPSFLIFFIIIIITILFPHVRRYMTL